VISNIKILVILLATSLGAGIAYAQESKGHRDSQAIEVLKNMSTYTASLRQLVIRGTAFSDARLDAGLMVSNSSEVELTIERPGSMRITSFDGVDKKDIYFFQGTLTVFSSDSSFYAQASIPKELEAAADFALEELGVDAPLMDLVYRDVSAQLLGSDDSIIYLADKSRVAGVNCHHIVIRGPEVDLQMWVEEGERPVPRKIVMTSKWESGSPRFTAHLAWDTAPQINTDVFKFTVPQGAIDIGFVSQTANP
jgi:hypothetical protein